MYSELQIDLFFGPLINLKRFLWQAIHCLECNGDMNTYPTALFLKDAKLFEVGAGTIVR